MKHGKIVANPAAHAPVTTTLRPALFARYADLANLRHDYPLVLVDFGEGRPLVRPLSRIIDETLRLVAPKDLTGEAMRQQLLQLEADIRGRVLAGEEARLSDFWRDCTAEMIRAKGEGPFGGLDNNFEIARKRLPYDGLVIGCNGETPAKVLSHAWSAKQAAKARRFRRVVDSLILRLSDILKSDHMKSDEAHGAEALEAAMGATADGSIDFGALSAVLERARPEDRLPVDRVARIRDALQVLKGQPFYGPGRASDTTPCKRDPYNYTFDTCSAALDAYRDRLPDVLAFTKALTIAELEVENKYRPELHDQILARFDESDMSAEQINMLPSALVCLRDGETVSAETARSFEALACGLPITVLVQVDDLLGPTSPEPPVNSFGAGTARLAAMAMGLNNAFVCQTSSAHINRMIDGLERGMRYEGPALFSIYSGATPNVPDVEPYILSAAATEARAFPSFTYDPSAGSDWASRFSLAGNPEAEKDWPVHEVVYENAKGERQAETLAFTFADFAICDSRYTRFCHLSDACEDALDRISAAEWLSCVPDTDPTRSPCVRVIDPEDQLFSVVVDTKIAEAASRCIDAWRRLQELAGINNSHSRRALAEERLKREAAAAQDAAPAAKAVETVTKPVETPAAPEPAAPVDQGSADGAAWIETPRCTTCNECVQTNDKLFAYNENMQAYVADPDGGTYRQLVEAAESCQVSIIHPGLPRNPDEPDLPELIERAAAFN
ncbi:ferredoxin [Aliiruegeria sabulilitoris]|uniref:ferredoxin n=1 Tax=Aliiruegeria sabulilitoris TaxID=1510458 RepID=UPI0008329AD0|nr:ferredoxin [Aliiruegeria sabulilitoris]NDR59714.1 hypothetical protein [Pseudoruegeria sp. M32A2M]